MITRSSKARRINTSSAMNLLSLERRRAVQDLTLHISGLIVDTGKQIAVDAFANDVAPEIIDDKRERELNIIVITCGYRSGAGSPGQAIDAVLVFDLGWQPGFVVQAARF